MSDITPEQRAILHGMAIELLTLYCPAEVMEELFTSITVDALAEQGATQEIMLRKAEAHLRTVCKHILGCASTSEEALGGLVSCVAVRLLVAITHEGRLPSSGPSAN